MKPQLLIGALLLLPFPLAAQTGSATPATTVPQGASANPADDVKTTGSAAGAQMQRDQMAREPVPAGQGAANTGATSPMAIGSAPMISTGQQVTDTSGAPVGRIESVDGDYAVLATSAAKVRVPRTSFADRNGTLVIAMTEAQVNAAAAGAEPPTR